MALKIQIRAVTVEDGIAVAAVDVNSREKTVLIAEQGKGVMHLLNPGNELVARLRGGGNIGLSVSGADQGIRVGVSIKEGRMDCIQSCAGKLGLDLNFPVDQESERCGKGREKGDHRKQRDQCIKGIQNQAQFALAVECFNVGSLLSQAERFPTLDLCACDKFRH